MKSEEHRAGQALLETLLGLLLVCAVLFPGAHLLLSEWNRARCAYQVFERARNALERPAEEPDASGAWVIRRARCGRAFEAVRLRRIEDEAAG